MYSFVTENPGTHFMSTMGADECQQMVDYCFKLAYDAINDHSISSLDALDLAEFYRERAEDYAISSSVS